MLNRQCGLSLFMAYKVELFGDFLQTHDPAVFNDTLAITELCLHIQLCAIQAKGKALGTLVLKEYAR